MPFLENNGVQKNGRFCGLYQSPLNLEQDKMPRTFTDLISKIPSLDKLASTINGNIKGREVSQLSIDKRFQEEAIKVIEQEGVHHSLFIINTGHSIPVGFKLLKLYGIPIIWAEDIQHLEKILVNRLQNQFISFADEINNASATNIDSLVVMLDCHASPAKPQFLPSVTDLINKKIRVCLQFTLATT